MKKIINNKVYDTTTAKKFGEYEPNPYHSDFHWFCETLYQKRTGEFFLHGEGNAASRYSKSCGQNEWCGDEKIIPLSYEVARQWAEDHLDSDDYISIFGEPSDDDDTLTALNLTVSATAAAKFKLAAQQQQITQRELMERLIDTL